MPFLGRYKPPATTEELQLEKRLRGHVDVLAGLIGPRHLGKKDSLEAAIAYIEQQFTAIGDHHRREPYSIGSAKVANLVVERIGLKNPQEIVLVGAHYDTVPETPGADDNASAVAMLLEVARLLRDLPAKRTTRFVAFTCEEPPHFYTDTMGSQLYARESRLRGENIVGMICLEMVGYYSSNSRSQDVPPLIPRPLRFAFPTTGNFLAAVANLRSIRLLLSFRRGFRRTNRFPLYCVALPERINEIRLSDNGSFWDQGYPAIMITDTSFLRNPHYHLPSDTPETLDYGRLTASTIGVAGGVARIAKAIRRVVNLDA